MSDTKVGKQAERRGRRTSGYVFKRGKIWWACWTIDGIKVRESTGKTTKDQARAVLEEKVAPYRQRQKVDVLASLNARLDRERTELERIRQRENRTLLKDAWTQHPYDHTAPSRGTRRRLSPRNVIENRSAWQRFVAYMDSAHPDTKHLEDVTHDQALAYSKYLREEEHLTAGRHNKLVTIAKVMFTLAGCPHPFAPVPRYEVHHESREALEVAQLRKVCQEASGEMRTLFAILLYTGLRLGDASTLRWCDIGHGMIHRVMAKTRKPVSFPVHAELQALLDEIPEKQRGKYVCPETAAMYAHTPQEISIRIREHFEACNIKCLEDRQDGKRRISRYGAHSFRHTFVTLCARAGVPQGLVRQWVGHASEEVTRIYEHWGPNEERQKILAALPAVMSATSAPTARSNPTETIIEEARRMAQQMSAKNWKAIRDSLLTILSRSTACEDAVDNQ